MSAQASMTVQRHMFKSQYVYKAAGYDIESIANLWDTKQTSQVLSIDTARIGHMWIAWLVCISRIWIQRFPSDHEEKYIYGLLREKSFR